MMVEVYAHHQHYELLSGWLRARGVAVPDKALFSDLGYVVDRIAIGFLFLGGNSRQASIDHVAADPEADSIARDRALSALLNMLEAAAWHADKVLVTALAELPAMKRRFEGLGYRAHGDYTLYYRAKGA